MALFVVLTDSENSALQSEIAKKFPNDHKHLASNHWVVSSDKTARELSDHLGISDGKKGSAIVFGLSSYYGRYSNDLWEWIKTKWEGGPHG